MDSIFYNKLAAIVKEEQVKKEEPMQKHTTFRVGGPADYFVMPESSEQVQEVVALCKEENIPYYIVGNGSNLLVSDQGYHGVIVQIGKKMSRIEVDGEQIRVQAGALLSAVANLALENNLTGFEFAAGIPGSFGGACVMNAGAYGGEMKDVLLSVTVLTPEGEFLTIPKEDLELGYRTSIIEKRQYLVLEAVIGLEEGDPKEIKALMDDLRQRRIDKQPLEYPSAGSTFKRPEGKVFRSEVRRCLRNMLVS